MVVKTRELTQFVGSEVTVKGWVHAIRRHKNVWFLVVRDSTGMVQVTCETSKNPEVTAVLSEITLESTVAVVGRVLSNPIVKPYGIEIVPTKIFLYSKALSPLPYDLWGTSLPSMEKRLDWRYLDLRRPENKLIFEVQTAVEMSMREYWYSKGFIEIHSPKLMGSPSESGSELFKVDYFGRVAFLAQSPQFYKQMAMAAGFDRVFEIGPVFRANPSFTSRHDTEFTSVDVEIAWIDSHYDLMTFQEQWLRHVFESISVEYGQLVRQTFSVDIAVPEIPFPKITYREAVEKLKSRGYVANPNSKGDIDPQGERMLSSIVLEEYGHEFVFITDYPVSLRPFYHMRYDTDPNTTKSFDLLWKGVEVSTGAQREHRYDYLCRQASEKKVCLSSIQFYIDFFKYGCPPHGGFGFGLTRMLMLLFGLSSVREVTYVYRGPKRLIP